jgi:hypothetical protein
VRIELGDMPVSCQLETQWRIHVPASTQRELEPFLSKASATDCTHLHSGNSVEGRLPVKKLLLTGIAVLFLATGAAHGLEPHRQNAQR